jgi:4'-phosphopantetheinyl transferase EntD
MLTSRKPQLGWLDPSDLLAAIAPPVVRAAAIADVVTDPSAAVSHAAQGNYPPAHLAHASSGRRAEFAAGRRCAESALADLGVMSTALARDRDGVPRWPAGTIGSITHTRGFVGAVVALRRDLRGLGLDAECHAALPDRLRTRIQCCAGEWSAADEATSGATEPGSLLFSAKESVYKLWFPIIRRPVAFPSIHVELSGPGTIAAPGKIRVRPTEREDRSLPDVAALGAVHGWWAASTSVVACLVVLDESQR